MPVAPSEDFLTRMWGPLPVWSWAGLGLGGAYLVSRWRANKNANQNQSTTSAGSAAQPATGGPEYIIENNLPWQSPSAPVNVSVTGSPITLPPGTGPQPPVPTGGHPPTGPGGAVNQGGTASSPITPVRAPASTPTSAPAAPTTHKVVAGDTLTKIAEENGFGANWQAIWQYNTGPASPRTATDKAILLKQGPNLILPGQTIYIPPR